jgi:acyl dehydratase
MNPPPDWDELEAGTAISTLSLAVTYDMVAGLIFATRDWFPGHHEPAYARSQGKPDIYLNTAFLQGFMDRVALSWAGCAWFVQRRQMRMLESVYPGDVLVGTGTVKSKRRSERGEPTMEVAIEARKKDALALTGVVTLALPSR